MITSSTAPSQSATLNPAPVETTPSIDPVVKQTENAAKKTIEQDWLMVNSPRQTPPSYHSSSVIKISNSSHRITKRPMTKEERIMIATLCPASKAVQVDDNA
ncbi:MAG: hypothetical protein JSS09_06060 [Verrucomicrobia bacterium]|nr:hypothetical protein [Verrucomicrobiota bacterium]